MNPSSSMLEVDWLYLVQGAATPMCSCITTLLHPENSFTAVLSNLGLSAASCLPIVVPEPCGEGLKQMSCVACSLLLSPLRVSVCVCLHLISRLYIKDQFLEGYLSVEQSGKK